MAITIRRIPAEQTLEIRLAILRTGMPMEAARFPDDLLDTAQHFGAFLGDQHVGVVSIYPAPAPDAPGLSGTWQLRGMATVPEVRGQGAGRALLLACVEAAMEQGGSLLWCNARKLAVEFYRKHGWAVTSEEFDIPTAGSHFRMSIPLKRV